ncbi:uncharacterized protein METZ01_LOCUS244587 [marine metagenome]|uniref:Uncharacterized protein n=1 Tax=marine metagenome TaxID=408172 RepID=A0A382HYM2_9ZZZZ
MNMDLNNASKLCCFVKTFPGKFEHFINLFFGFGLWKQDDHGVLYGRITRPLQK